MILLPLNENPVSIIELQIIHLEPALVDHLVVGQD
jgi:hypothetical protein